MEIVVSPQGAQFFVGFEEDFLCHVLSVVEVAEFGVGQRIDSLFVPGHQQPKRRRVAVETFIYCQWSQQFPAAKIGALHVRFGL